MYSKCNSILILPSIFVNAEHRAARLELCRTKIPDLYNFNSLGPMPKSPVRGELRP